MIYKAQKGRNGNSEVLISPVKKQEFIQELERRSRIFMQKGRNGNSEVLISPVKKQEFIQELERRSRIFMTK